MLKTKIFILIVFSASCLRAQTNLPAALDSLYMLWQDGTQPDSTRVQACNRYIWKGFLFSQPDSAFTLAEKLISFGLDNNYPIAQGLGYSIQGISWARKSDYPKALDYFTQSLTIRKQMGDQSGVAAILNNIGIIYVHQGDYPKALDYHTKSLKIKEQIGDQRGIASSFNSIGLIYSGQGDYPKALDYHTKSLKITEQIGGQKGIADALNNIGNIYLDQGDYPKALDYYTKSLIITEQIGDQKGIAGCLNNIGQIYKHQGDYPKALDYFTKSLKIREQIGNQKGIASSFNSIGLIYNVQGDYPKALDYCQRSYKLALSIEALENQEDACNCLYATYKAIGNGNKALEYHELLSIVEDSLQSEETAKKLQQMEFQKTMLADSLAQVEKDRLVTFAHEEEVRKKNKTRNVLAGSGLLALLLAGGFFSRWRYVRKSKAIIEKEKDRSDNLLLNILPAEIAEELKIKGKADARDFDLVSILFTDFVSFTETSEKLSAAELVTEINACFEAFDHIIEKYSVEKIKTIGDAYMAAGGLPVPSDNSVKNTVLAALEMQTFITKRKADMDAKGELAFEMRVGIHTGPVVAGIVGVKKFQYDIWGDTVNTASRIESKGAIGKINISQTTYEHLKEDPEFIFESRGKIQAKGKGEIDMYYVNRNESHESQVKA